MKLTRSLVVSLYLYVCESWTLTAELENRKQVFEVRCYGMLLNLSYKDRVTNEKVRSKIPAAIQEYDELQTMVKKNPPKLMWFGHVSWSFSLPETILQGTVNGKRRRGRHTKRWEDSMKEWTRNGYTNLTRAAKDRTRWKGVVAKPSVVLKRPCKVIGETRLVYGLQQYGYLNNSCPLCFLMCSVL